MRHPEQFFARPHEHARVALENPYILTDQLRCAMSELAQSSRELDDNDEDSPVREADDLEIEAELEALKKKKKASE